MPIVFTYGTDLDVFSVESNGKLIQRFHDKEWHKLELGSGCRVGAVPVVFRDYGGDLGRLDIFVEATSGMAHAWFTNSTWDFEILT